MSLQEIYYVAEMVVGVAVIISIVFVAIELRQNTYVTRKSMGDAREQRINWFHETMSTNEEFRGFVHRMVTEFEDLNTDERLRATSIGIRQLRSVLNELEAYFDGQISDNEWQNLVWNIKFYKARPHIAACWEFIRDGYSERTQRYWDEFDAEFEKLRELIYAR